MTVNLNGTNSNSYVQNGLGNTSNVEPKEVEDTTNQASGFAVAKMTKDSAWYQETLQQNGGAGFLKNVLGVQNQDVINFVLEVGRNDPRRDMGEFINKIAHMAAGPDGRLSPDEANSLNNAALILAQKGYTIGATMEGGLGAQQNTASAPQQANPATSSQALAQQGLLPTSALTQDPATANSQAPREARGQQQTGFGDWLAGLFGMLPQILGPVHAYSPSSRGFVRGVRRVLGFLPLIQTGITLLGGLFGVGKST